MAVPYKKIARKDPRKTDAIEKSATGHFRPKRKPGKHCVRNEGEKFVIIGRY